MRRMSTGNQQRAPRRGLPWRQHRGLLVLCLMGVLAFVLLILSVFGDQGVFRIRLLDRDRVILEQKVQEHRERQRDAAPETP